MYVYIPITHTYTHTNTVNTYHRSLPWAQGIEWRSLKSGSSWPQSRTRRQCPDQSDPETAALVSPWTTLSVYRHKQVCHKTHRPLIHVVIKCNHNVTTFTDNDIAYVYNAYIIHMMIWVSKVYQKCDIPCQNPKWLTFSYFVSTVSDQNQQAIKMD